MVQSPVNTIKHIKGLELIKGIELAFGSSVIRPKKQIRGAAKTLRVGKLIWYILEKKEHPLVGSTVSKIQITEGNLWTD